MKRLVTANPESERTHRFPAAHGMPHAGVAYALPGKRSIGELVDGLFLIYEALTPEQMIGNVEYL